MWAILRVWTLINIPDNVITADTGTGGDTRVKVCFTLSRSRPATPGSGSDPYHGDHETKPRHQNLLTALIWENWDGSLLGLLILSLAIIQATQHSWERWRARANETWGDAAHWYSNLIVRRRQTRTETIQIEISKLESSLLEICLSLRMTTS